jgi:ribulose-5-phosphate 4-epimerase/fuculose-1-phosphate aldolase
MQSIFKFMQPVLMSWQQHTLIQFTAKAGLASIVSSTPLTQDACSFYEDHSLFDDYTGVVLQLDEGKRTAIALGEKKAIILRNHGLLTVGYSVDEAAWWFVAMERSCQAQLMAEAAGTPILIYSENARLAQRQVGSHQVGWFSFQPLYELIVHQQPELLE